MSTIHYSIMSSSFNSTSLSYKRLKTLLSYSAMNAKKSGSMITHLDQTKSHTNPAFALLILKATGVNHVNPFAKATGELCYAFNVIDKTDLIKASHTRLSKKTLDYLSNISCQLVGSSLSVQTFFLSEQSLQKTLPTFRTTQTFQKAQLTYLTTLLIAGSYTKTQDDIAQQFDKLLGVLVLKDGQVILIKPDEIKQSLKTASFYAKSSLVSQANQGLAPVLTSVAHLRKCVSCLTTYQRYHFKQLLSILSVPIKRNS